MECIITAGMVFVCSFVQWTTGTDKMLNKFGYFGLMKFHWFLQRTQYANVCAEWGTTSKLIKSAKKIWEKIERYTRGHTKKIEKNTQIFNKNGDNSILVTAHSFWHSQVFIHHISFVHSCISPLHLLASFTLEMVHVFGVKINLKFIFYIQMKTDINM